MDNVINRLPDYMVDFINEEFNKFTGEHFDFDFVYNANLKDGSYVIHTSTIEFSSFNSAVSAVYHYISAKYNINFSTFTPTVSMGRDLEYGMEYSPLLKRRGNVLEVINDTGYLKELIAWLSHNGGNEIFFTFFLWDEVKDAIYEELKLRDIKVTLGGHSLKYLMNKESIDPQSFSFTNNTQLIEKICESVRDYPLIERVSLWPEDVGIVEGNGDAFFGDYIKFTNELQRSLPEIEVEHIVYNAGLSWDMLLPPKLDNFKAETNALYAYWGRDYSQMIEDENPNQKKANDALKWWIKHQKEGNKDLTIFEYYSDFFMLSEFYGPMSKVIANDIKWYIEQGVDSVVNLQVPLINGRYFEYIKDTYDYKHLHNYNNFVYLRSLWGETLESIDALWFAQYGDDKDKVRKLVKNLEERLPKFTKYNVSIFPKRYVDAHLDEMDDILVEIIQLIDRAIPLKRCEAIWHYDFLQLREICELYLKKTA